MTLQPKTKIILSVLLVGAGVGVYFLTRPKKTSQGGTYQDEQDYSNSTLVFNPKAIAENLFEAMNTTGKGVLNFQKDNIFEILSNVTSTQFGGVVKAFGLRPYNLFYGNQRYVWPQKLNKYGLKTWLKNELEPKDYLVLQRKYSKYL